MYNEFLSVFSLPVIRPDWIKILPEDFMTATIIMTFGILLALEINLVRHDRSKTVMLKSYQTNFLTLILNDVLISLLSISSLLLLAERHGQQGLLSGFDLPVKILISLILLDLTLYFWHRANHKFGWLWVFHKVHHSDKSMNVTTAFRLHIVEVFLTTVIKMLFIISMGIETIVIAICETITALFAIFHHANFYFEGEKWLGRLMVVPNIHRVHHSSLRKEHDNNYGAILSIWDRIFRTLCELQPKDIGLTNVKAQNFFELLRFGFMPFFPEKYPPLVINLNAMISEAAYYKAQKRGFSSPGDEFLDWLDAEKEIYEIYNRI